MAVSVLDIRMMLVLLLWNEYAVGLKEPTKGVKACMEEIFLQHACFAIHWHSHSFFFFFVF